MKRAVAAAAGALAVACAPVAAGCSTGESGDAEAPPPREAAVSPSERERAAPARAFPRASCPPAASNCRTASGRVLYVERVDPDGDGDAHFVLASRDSITGPGISVIDVRRSLRPSPLPGPGDRLSAAGPVYTGSYGQRQIEATELHVAR